MSTSPSKVIIKRDRHVGLRAEVDLASPQRGVRKLAAVLHLTVVLIPIFIDPERPGSSWLRNLHVICWIVPGR